MGMAKLIYYDFIHSIIIWTTLRSGEMNQNLRCDEAILPAQEFPPCPVRKIFSKPYNKSFIEKACSAKMPGF